MNVKRNTFLVGAAAVLVAIAPHARAQNPGTPPASADWNDKGVYTISFAGRPIGAERFAIHSSPSKIEAEGEIEIKSEQSGQAVNLKSTPKLVLSPQFEPQSYVINQKGSPQFHLEVDFRATPVKSRLHLSTSKDDDVRELVLTKDVAVLDDNVIHHYQLLVDRFFTKTEKEQTFKAYTPQEAVPGTLTVQDAGPETVNFGGKNGMMHHLVVTTELAQIDLWVDAQQHLQRVFIPAMQLEALRTK